MGIPGRTLDRVETRAKVRVGIKDEKSRPRSVDYFVSDDDEFGRAYEAPQPRELRILLPYAEAERCFSTGLEWWQGQLLACYTHDGGSDATALRVQGMAIKGRSTPLNMVDADDVTRGPVSDKGRQPVACRGDACPHFGKNPKKAECRPMGRLQFFLEGGQTTEALQLDTKAWGTIENLAGTLGSAARSGPLNAPGRVFVLSVAWERKGSDRWPVCSIKEDVVQINNPEDAGKADALIAIEYGIAHEWGAGATLVAALNYYRPGWKDDAVLVQRIKDQTPEVALQKMHANLLELAAA